MRFLSSSSVIYLNILVIYVVGCGITDRDFQLSLKDYPSNPSHPVLNPSLPSYVSLALCLGVTVGSNLIL